MVAYIASVEIDDSSKRRVCAETLRFRHSSTASLGEYPLKKRIIHSGVGFRTIINNRRLRMKSP